MKRVLIIAEAGVNHNGSLENAKKLVEAAALAGADFVKFQTFKSEKLVAKDAKKAEYQKKNQPNETDSQFEMLKKLEMPISWHEELIDFSKEKGIKFLSTGFDDESIDLLDSLGIPFYKIPSGELTNKPFLKHVASKRKPIIISTGMATMGEIGNALKVLNAGGITLENISVLHCNTEYPTPMRDVNLLAMNHIKNSFGVKVGYSDHTLGIEVPIAAVALGAEIIEKHFTLDKNLEGPDHLASLEPEELKQMISAIRNIELATSGNGLKEPSDSEMKNIQIARKSLHFSKSLEPGHQITESDLIAIRPGTGISPMDIDLYIGKKIKVSVDAFSLLEINHII